MADLRPMIAEHAERLRALHEAIHRAWRLKPHGAAHHAACRAFHVRFDALAFPGGLEAGRERLKRLDPSTVEVAVQFLEEDPWFHRSGYLKEEIVRRLKQAELTQTQRNRLAEVVERSLVQGTGRLARHLARLAPCITSSAFVAGVGIQARSTQAEGRRRAQHVLRVLCSARQVDEPPR